MNCDEAIQIIIESDESLMRQALNYVMHHPGCLARVDQLTRAILSDQEHELSCAETRTRLSTYYELEAGEIDGSLKLPEVHQHLHRCPYCLLEYRMLQQTMSAPAQEALPSPDQLPVFDLSFLPLASPPRPLWTLQNHVRTFIEEISIMLAEKSAIFRPFVVANAPTLSAAIPLRSAEHEARYAVLMLPDEGAGVRFQIETGTADQTHALITVRLFDAITNKVVPDARVTLRTASGQLLAGTRTEADGKAVFHSLTQGHYLIQIRHQEATWELPIVIIPV